MYDLLDLRLLVAVVDTGSITAGAARLPLGLPAASARIRGLEDGAGVPLLVRGRRGVRPTPAGLAFVRHARDVVDGMHRLDGAVAAYRSGVARLTLVAGSSPMQHLVPRALVSFLTEHAGVDVVTAERRSADSVRLLDEGRADLGVVIAPVGEPVAAADRLTDDSLVAIGPTDGTLAGRDAVAFAEVAEHPMVGLTEDSPLQQTLAANLGATGPLVRHRGRAVGLGTVVALAAAGVGLAVVPRHTVDPGLGLAVCELTDPWARRTLVLRRGRHPGPGTEDLAEHLRRAAHGPDENQPSSSPKADFGDET